MSDTLVVNLYGGPGTGKSTVCAQLFSNLKWMDVNCEMVREYAKEKVWENSLDVLDDQIHIFGEQIHRMKMLLGKVDVIITDSPILLSVMYGKNESDLFKQHVYEEYSKFNNLDIVLVRKKKFNPKGRVQTLEQAKEMDHYLMDLVTERSKKSVAYEATKQCCEDMITPFVFEEVKALQERQRA